MNNNDNMDDEVMNILAILQQSPNSETSEVEKKKSENKVKTSKKDTPSVNEGITADISTSTPKLKKEKPLVSKQPATFMAEMIEPEDKSIYNSKVLIREEIYEIFMSLKRVNKIKSVSTLIDFALEDYIKRNKDDIKKALFERKSSDFL